MSSSSSIRLYKEMNEKGRVEATAQFLTFAYSTSIRADCVFNLQLRFGITYYQKAVHLADVTV